MLFNSAPFVVFLVVVYGLYVVVGSHRQNRLLLGASLFFYASWDWRLLSLLLITIAVDYSVGRTLERLDDQRARRLLLVASLSANLTLLGLFKYFDFFVDSANALLARLSVEGHLLHLELVLPIGISFYTFHSMSYVIDVYARRTTACRSIADYALFVSFFPQLVAGPIARARQLLPQLQAPRRVTSDQLVGGLYLVLIGYLEKVVIADGCSWIVNAVFADDAAYGGLDKLIAVYAFAFQILGDFAGYTDIARGIAKIMGIELSLNFDLPYFATNPSEFWRRWHISLSSWLRDYLYIPLGGSRLGRLRTYGNLFVTMLLGGLWHGASWTMVLWGAYHGAALVIHRALTSDRDRGVERRRPWSRNTLQALGTFQLVSLGWLIFRARDVEQVGRFLISIGAGLQPSAHTASFAGLFAQLVLPFVAFQLWQLRAGTLEPYLRLSPARRSAFILGACWLAVTVVVFHRALIRSRLLNPPPFIYFQF